MRRESTAREEIVRAYAELMREDPKRITVAAILNRAHVSRATFYYHFSGLDDVLQSMTSRFADVLADTMSLSENHEVSDSQENALRARSERILGHFYENRNYLEVILDSAHRDEFCEMVASVFIDATIGIDHYRDGRRLSRRDKSYYEYMNAWSLVGAILCWHQRGYAETPEEMVDILYDLNVHKDMDLVVN